MAGPHNVGDLRLYYQPEHTHRLFIQKYKSVYLIQLVIYITSVSYLSAS